MPYNQFQIDEKGVKVRYRDPQYQMPRKDHGAAKSLIFSDLRQLRYHYGLGLKQSQYCEVSWTLIGIRHRHHWHLNNQWAAWQHISRPTLDTKPYFVIGLKFLNSPELKDCFFSSGLTLATLWSVGSIPESTERLIIFVITELTIHDKNRNRV